MSLVTKSLRPSVPEWEVAERAGGLALRALRVFSPGESILELEGMVVETPSLGSVQIGRELHLEVSPGLTLEQQALVHPWRFLDHSCDPSARIRGRELIARRSIAVHEAITFDYCTTEAFMAAPFRCRCGAERCLVSVAGWFGLTEGERELRRSDAAPWLMESAQRATPRGGSRVFGA